MKRSIGWFLSAALIFLGFSSLAIAAETDQTHLSDLVKTKQLLFVKITHHFDEILPVKMARISAYEATLADIIERAHQLSFLIAVSESNPFEVRMYFKQAMELRDEFERETRAVRDLAQEVRINLSIVERSRQDLRFIAQTAVSKDQKQDAGFLLNYLDRFETTQLKIKGTLDSVLAKADEAEKESVQYTREVKEAMMEVWSIYFTKPLFVLFDKVALEELPLSYTIWAGSLGPTLESKLPDSPVEWGLSACGFLAAGFIFLLLFRWVLDHIGTRSHGNQEQWIRIYRASRVSVFLYAGFWATALIGVFPENVIFSRLAVIFGSLAAVSLAWGLRDIKFRSGHSSPLYPLFYLFTAGIVAQIANTPLRLLGVLWPLGVGAMMLFMWRTAGKFKDPVPRRLARFCFWSGFPIICLSLAGFTFPAIEVFLTLFLCCIVYQFASAVSDLIRRRLDRMQEKGNSLLRSMTVSLGIPIIWFIAVGVVVLWLTDQFGNSGIVELTNRFQFRWQDLRFGFVQMVVAVALFFVVKSVAEVLKGGIERVSRKSRVDEAIMAPIQTVVVCGVWVLFSLLLLHIIGVRLSSIVVLAGGMSVGIGFGLQHIINNFVSGLILLFGRSVRPGDVIEHGLVLGEVEKVTVRSTLVRTRDDTTMLIPNSNLVSMPFVNMSRDNRAVRLIVGVGADYDSDPDLVEHILLEAAHEHPDILKHPTPRVRFEDFQDSYLDFRIKFWVDFDGSKRVASDLRFAILKKFRKQGVQIAFPQLDLHLKNATNFRQGHAVDESENRHLSPVEPM